MDYEQILFEREGPVGIVKLNRPDKLNPFTWKMIQEILDVLDGVEKEDVIRVLVITGAGRAFSSGDDISGAFYKGSPWENAPDRPPFALRSQQKLINALRRLPKPVIAMINGLVHGMGSDVALACDFRIASEEARLGDIRMQKPFDEFVPEYNLERPHEALGQKTPASLYQPSLRSYPARLPKIAYHGFYCQAGAP